MSNRVLGILQIFPNKDDPDIKAVFNLKQGDNFVGSSPFCEVIFPQDDIEAVHCKISLNDDGEYFIEDVGSSSGVFRSGSDGGLQRLRIHKEYELPINKAFYLGTKYKCLFMPKLAKSMAEPESRSPQKPYSSAYNGGNIAKTQEVTTLQIPSLQHEMDEIGYPSQTQTPSQSDAPSRPKTKLTGHLASLVHTADFRNSLDEYSDPKFTQEGGTLSQNESDAGYGGLTMKAFRPKKSPNKSADKDVMPSLVPAGYEEDEEFQRPEEVVTPYKAETKKTKAKQKEEDDNVGLSLIARKGKNQLDNMSEEEEDNEEVEQQQVSFRKSSKNNSPGEDNSVLSSTRNTLLARQDKEDSNDSTFIKSFKNKKSEPEKVVGKMLGNYSNGRKSSDESEGREESREQSQEEPREEKKAKEAKEAKEEVHDAGTVKHFKKKGGLMGTMLGLMKNKNGGRMEDEEDDNEMLRPDMSQDIGGKTIAQQKKEQERKREEEQRRKEQEKKEKEEEQQRRKELEKKKEEEQRRKEQEKKKEEEHRKKEEQKRKEEEQRRKKEEEQQKIAKKKEEEQRAAAKKEEDEQLRGSRDMRKSGQTKKEEDESNKLKKEAKQEEDEEKGRKGRATRGNSRVNTKKEKEESPMEIVTRKDELKREDSEEREYDDGDDGSGESLDGLPFRKATKLRDEDKEKDNTQPKKSMEEEERRTSTRRGRKKSEADEEEESTPKKKVVGKRGGKKSAEKEKEIEVEKKKGRGGKKGKEEMEVEEEADDKKRKKRAASGKKGKKVDEEDSLMARLLRRQNEMAEMLKPYSDSDEEEEEESTKFVKGKKKVNERGKVKEEPKELKKKGKVDEEDEKPKPKRGKKAVDSPKKTKESEEKVTTRSTRSKGKAADKQEKKAQAKNKKHISDEEDDEEEEEEEMNTSMRRSSRSSAKAKADPPKKESPKKNARTKSMEESDSKGRKKVKTEAGSDMKKSMTQSQKSAAAKKTTKKKEVMEEEETSDLDELNLPKRNAYRVIFSGFEPNDGRVDDAKRDLESIGVKVFEDKERDFNVLVMERFKRTIKFLLAVSRGVSIVSFKWVKDSLEEGQALPPEDYVYVDKGAESKFKFKLSTTLQKAKSNQRPLMEGHRVWVSPSIKPSVEEVKILIESMGGTVIKARPTARSGEDVLCIVNEDDTKTARNLSEMGLSVYTTELVYSAILQQKLNLNQNLVK